MKVSVVVSIIIALVIFVGGAFLVRKADKGKEVEVQEQVQDVVEEKMEESDTMDSVADPTELLIEDIIEGTGEEAVAGKTVSVHYTGTLTDGTKFDSSVDRGQPFSFILGAGQVIQGWDQGFAGMKVGGKRKLTIPSDMGYGEQGSPPVIPPNSTLVFDVELLGVE